jgi:hypothetical protein
MSDETRGSSRVMFDAECPEPLSSLQSLLWFDPARGLLPSRPQNREAIARSGSARVARSATRRARP